MNNDGRDIGAMIAGVLTETPIGFRIRDRHEYLYPLTLGKLYVTSRIVENLGIDKGRLAVDPFAEMLRIVRAEREACCRLVACYLAKGKEELFDADLMKERADWISDHYDDDDIVTIIVSVLKNTDTETIAAETGMNREQEFLAKANAAKKDGNTLVFGGKTIWGTLLDTACERYGWTLDYVLWGISHANLTLMLKDRVTSVYLTDEERKHCHIPRDRSRVNGDDKAAIMRLAMQENAVPN